MNLRRTCLSLLLISGVVGFAHLGHAQEWDEGPEDLENLSDVVPDEEASDANIDLETNEANNVKVDEAAKAKPEQKVGRKKPNDQILKDLRKSMGADASIEEISPYESLEEDELVRREKERQQVENLRRSLRKDVQLVEISPYSTGPFNERRPKWTSVVSLFYSRYNPLEYVSDQAPTQGTLEQYFQDPETPLSGVNFDIKRNLAWASFFLQIGVGSYYNSARDGASLTLTPIMTGLGLALDALFREPYVVPYGLVGGYTMFFREAPNGSASVNGNTSPAPFFALGLKVQLDWMDEHSDLSGFNESGLENTFIYGEVRNFLSSGSRKFDFRTPTKDPYQLTAGLSLEF